MNKEQAISAMQKIWGKRAAYRYNKKALIGDEREKLRAELPALHAKEKEAIAARDARREELLKDPEYLRLREVAKEAMAERQGANAKIFSRRVTLGEMVGEFFIIRAEGDNWNEAITKAKGEK